MGYLTGKPVIVALAPLALAACTPTTQAVIDAAAGQGVEGIKRAEDTKAAVALQAPCAVTAGAFNRLSDPTKQRAVMTLCGGNQERPVTVEDLQSFLNRK